MRVVSQNIRHGGGDRVDGLVLRWCELDPDVLRFRNRKLSDHAAMVVEMEDARPSDVETPR